MERTLPLIKAISIVEGEAGGKQDLADSREAAFCISGNKRLRLDVNGWRHLAAPYLEHAICRSPEDLRSHVQRVYLHIDKEDGDNLFGALLDLFIALGDAGGALRQRLLEISRTILERQHYRFLSERLEAGFGPTDPIPACDTSLLSKGINGTNRLVSKQDGRDPVQRDPIQEAREYIEYGQIDEAREVLETAILENPQRPELHQDLLDIYRSTRAKAAFDDMRQRIPAESNPAAAAWQELADRFAREHR